MAKLEPTESDIERRLMQVHEQRAVREFRWSKRLGASAIGHECARKLWLDFRWAAREQFTGQQLRVFERGNIEENRIVQNLIDCELEVFHITDDGEQFTFTAVGGHFVAKIDGVVKGLSESKAPHLLEVKSSNQKGFDRLLKLGVEKGKPEHYAQCQVSMKLAELQRCLYICSNKNTEQFYTERLRYDKAFALELLAKAKRVIHDVKAPAKVTPNYIGWPCKWCKFNAMCHESALPTERNCRTCIHSSPIADGKWHCDKFMTELSDELQVRGCNSHRYHPDLMPYEAVDSDEQSVTYRLPDGSYIYNHRGGTIDDIPF